MINIPNNLNLRIPGPTPLPAEVREALAQPMIGHRSYAFSAIHREVTEALKQMLRTENDVFVLTASGTGAMEAAVVNTLSPGDKVLSVSIGYFGERFRTIAKAYGAEIIPLDYAWGTAADPNAIGSALAKHPELKAVLVTHNETSTGVTNPLKEIAAVVKDRPEPFDPSTGLRAGSAQDRWSRRAGGDASPLLLVDAISSAGCIELETDVWNIDVLVTGSQKGWMIPPGLAYVTFSEAAWEAHEQSTMPRFYFDLTAAKKKLPANQTPWTPAVNLLYGLAAALRLMRREGLENIWARHQRIAEYTRQRVREMGLELLADPQHASNTVTAVRVPASPSTGPSTSSGQRPSTGSGQRPSAGSGQRPSTGSGQRLDVAQLRRRLEEQHQVILAGGQGPLKGQIFRIGHLGNVDQADIDAALAAIGAELEQHSENYRGARE